MDCSRRRFLSAGVAAPAVAAGLGAAEAAPAPGPSGHSTLLDVNFRNLIARADLEYTKPVSRSEEGVPIGNGTMGTLLWTAASSLRMQVNRVDVFAMDGSSHSFPERDTDYSGGCGFLDVAFIDAGEDVFAGDAFRQQLSVYDGMATTRGRGVALRACAWQEGDAIAIEVDDQRPRPSPVSIDLRMLRFVRQYHAGRNFELSSQNTVMVRTRSHTAASKLDIRGGRILLTQAFDEGGYHCRSAVAVAVDGRPAKACYPSEDTVRLVVAPGKGKYTILIASAAGFDPAADIGAAAVKVLDAAGAKGFAGVVEDNRRWWQEFWSRSFVHLHSADGVADFVEQNYTYLMYLMASSMRGPYPPRFGGLVWGTNGDMRQWGSQHWWHNLSCYCDAMPPANRFELLDPMFRMYSGMYEASAEAARQQWGSQGIFIPETVWFDGLEKLPDDIAAEMRELYLLRKPWEERSQRFREYAATKHPHSSRWNWRDRGKWVEGRWEEGVKYNSPYGEVNHIYSSGAKISYLYWLRYEYTQDKQWLRERAYPMLKGVAEFYRHHPKVTKGEDGKVHIHDVNDHEPIRGAQDTLEEITAMRYIFPAAARAAGILGVDAELAAAWKEMADNLAPLPTNDQPDSLDPREPGQPRLWTNGRKPAISGRPTRASDHLLVPAVHYDFCSLETEDAELLRVANATFDSVFPKGVDAKTPIHVLSRAGLAAAHLGRAGELHYLIPNQIRVLDAAHDFCDWVGGGKPGVFPNRLTIREGPGAIDAQRLGRASAALHQAMLQAAPPAPGKDPVIRVFPAWPKEWDAAFTLVTAGAFLVTSSFRQGGIEFVELRSQAGGTCRIRNPWVGEEVSVYRDNRKAEDARGPLLEIDTKQGETLVLMRGSASPDRFRRTVMA